MENETKTTEKPFSLSYTDKSVTEVAKTKQITFPYYFKRGYGIYCFTNQEAGVQVVNVKSHEQLQRVNNVSVWVGDGHEEITEEEFLSVFEIVSHIMRVVVI